MTRLTMLFFSGFLATNVLAQASPADILKLDNAITTLPDSPARHHFNTISKNAQKDKEPAALKLPNNPRIASSIVNENIQRLDEIRVLGNAEPEDYVAPKPPPMLVFRAMLDAQRPRTLAEKLLQDCFICPQNPPREGNVVDRFDAKKFDAPLIIARPRGSFQ